jgi:hypothetical protein
MNHLMQIRRLPVLALVLAIHLLMVFMIMTIPGQKPPALAVTALIGTFESLSSSDIRSAGVLAPRRSPHFGPPSGSHLATERSATPSGHVVPPRVDESYAVDPAPYARRAGLATGQGAMIVLRIEVLKSGAAGHITVDLSSGNSVIDAAAIAYARDRHWTAGTADGKPTTLWIRWGVRLQR